MGVSFGFRSSEPGTRTEFRVLRNGNPLYNSFLDVFQHTETFRYIFSFILRELTIGSRVPGNANPHGVPGSQEREPISGSQEPGTLLKFLFPSNLVQGFLFLGTRNRQLFTSNERKDRSKCLSVLKKTSKKELSSVFPGTRKPIVTSLRMKEKIYLNVSVCCKTSRNELSSGFPFLSVPFLRNGNLDTPKQGFGFLETPFL